MQNDSHLQCVLEKVLLRLIYENSKNKKSISGSHPEEQYMKWHDFEKYWFGKKGLTTWDKDRKVTEKYLEDIGLI